jgi:hypothetical protein
MSPPCQQPARYKAVDAWLFFIVAVSEKNFCTNFLARFPVLLFFGVPEFHTSRKEILLI